MMIRMNRIAGFVVLAAIFSVASAQTLAQRLQNAGSMSFKINNADYSINIGPDCANPFASGTTGAQNTLTINFLPNSLDFEVTINQIVNSIGSNQIVRFNATVSNDGNRITWTAQNIPNPVCAIVSISGNDTPFRIDTVYGTLIADLSETSCVNDPLGALSRKVDISLSLASGSEVGFNGWVADGVCSTLFFPACARAFNIQLAGYGGRCPAGDVNNDGCVDDADLLEVLFNFGGSGGSADVNSDGIVDDADLLIVLFNFGAGC
ncbi:MAG: hypothetical protein KatS3mg020_0188 [Fimbriimonadales bacterium]|nr:MAG: hypothetical protein KatS3mg020_0188 [Fimbriimonadales bacterium]